MIRFLWKGVEVTARRTADGWHGPPDCPLAAFESEAEAAERLGGSVHPEESPTPPIGDRSHDSA